jgi:hypothetical protein
MERCSANETATKASRIQLLALHRPYITLHGLAVNRHAVLNPQPRIAGILTIQEPWDPLKAPASSAQPGVMLEIEAVGEAECSRRSSRPSTMTRITAALICIETQFPDLVFHLGTSGVQHFSWKRACAGSTGISRTTSQSHPTAVVGHMRFFPPDMA